MEQDDDDFQETRPQPKRSRTLPPQQNLIGNNIRKIIVRYTFSLYVVEIWDQY